jgi:hypothetical protein
VATSEGAVVFENELENWKKATANLDAQWVKEMDGRGYKGQELLDSARKMISDNS